jgi:mannose-6-phosphate isomerase-like protein (cupin superfamily)/N-acetylglutamate synthase-like GNAT family acetyltransferase
MNSLKINPEHYFWGEQCEGWHLLKSKSLSVIEEKMPPYTREELHCHRYAQQLFYVLSGEANFEINGEIAIIHKGESILIKPKLLHRIFNNNNDELSFILISEPAVGDDRIEIVNYSDELKSFIKTLNVEWLTKYFRVEPIDEKQLSDPVKEIINKGGKIFFAKHKQEVVGTASLLKVSDEIFELGKMAVTESAQGAGIGSVLMDQCIIEARKLDLKKLILYSNRKLDAAIHLYKKYGFNEVPMEAGHYERANIKMEKLLT